MQSLRAARVDPLRRGRGALAVAGRSAVPTPPAWRTLAVTVAVVMALWAAAIPALPESWQRFGNWAGGLGVLAVLVGWVRANASALACERDLRPHDAHLGVRFIRSRRPPLPEIGGPALASPRRRAAARGRPGS